MTSKTTRGNEYTNSNSSKSRMGKNIETIAYMKKEAVTTRPIASMKTARVGYHASGTGLEIDFVV